MGCEAPVITRKVVEDHQERRGNSHMAAWLAESFEGSDCFERVTDMLKHLFADHDVKRAGQTLWGVAETERCHVPVVVTPAVKVAGPPRRTA
jgi:hypothetical protein